MVSHFALIVIVAAVALGLLILGMSLTLIFKGHHIRSEIADNPDMKRLGIRCTAEQMREGEPGYDPAKGCASGCATKDCAACGETSLRNE